MKNQKPKGKQKKPSSAKKINYQQEAQALWSKIIRLRAGNKCEMSGLTSSDGHILQSHHLFQVSSNRCFKYDLNNGICLTQGQHAYAKNSPHRTTESCVRFFHWLRNNIPDRYLWFIERLYDHPDRDRKETDKQAYERLKPIYEAMLRGEE